MATVVVNQPDVIEFKNLNSGKPEDMPTLNAQAGAFTGPAGSSEIGVVFDVFGADAPILTPADARKLAKWLTRAADALDGASKEKKPKNNRHWQQDDDAY